MYTAPPPAAGPSPAGPYKTVPSTTANNNNADAKIAQSTVQHIPCVEPASVLPPGMPADGMSLLRGMVWQGLCISHDSAMSWMESNARVAKICICPLLGVTSAVLDRLVAVLGAVVSGSQIVMGVAGYQVRVMRSLQARTYGTDRSTEILDASFVADADAEVTAAASAAVALAVGVAAAAAAAADGEEVNIPCSGRIINALLDCRGSQRQLPGCSSHMLSGVGTD